MKANKSAYHLLSLLLIIAFILITHRLALAQGEIQLIVDNIVNDAFPEMQIKLAVLDENGSPLHNLTEENFAISENGQVVPELSVSTSENRPLSIVLLADTSNVMNYGEQPHPIEYLREALSNFASKLGTDDQVTLITYGDEIINKQAWTKDKSLIQTSVEGVTAQGSALLYDALAESLDQLTGQPPQRVIVIIANAPEAGYSLTKFDELISSINQEQTHIFSIGLPNAKQDELERFATLSGGSHQRLTNAEDLENALDALLPEFQNLREQYQLGYTSQLPADNQEYEVRVTVNYLGKYAEQSVPVQTVSREVKILTPGLADGQKVGGLIDITHQLIAPAPIEQIKFEVDDQTVMTLYPPDFSGTWDSSKVPEGIHELRFSAEDEAGNTGELSFVVEIIPPISVTILEPIDQATLTGPSTIRASAESTSKITGIDFYIDENLIGSDNSAPYEIDFDTSALTPGMHEMRAVAKDLQGFEGEATISTNVAIQDNTGLIWIVLIVLLGSVAIIVPLSLRRRRKNSVGKSLNGETPDKSGQQAEPVLVEIEGLTPGQRWSLGAEEVRLGRQRNENDIFLAGKNASRKQAILQKQGTEYAIISLREDNPVLVNGKPVVSTQLLNPGDMIQAGESTFRYEV